MSKQLLTKGQSRYLLWLWFIIIAGLDIASIITVICKIGPGLWSIVFSISFTALFGVAAFVRLPVNSSSSSPSCPKTPLISRRSFLSKLGGFVLTLSFTACSSPTRPQPATNFINEFPHPDFIVNYDPDPGLQPYTLDILQYALDRKVPALQLHVFYRATDGAVIWEHNHG